MTITIYKNIKATSSGFHRDVHYVLDRIKEGKSLGLLNQIRLEKDHDKRAELKQGLPSICFSGTFRQRSDAGIVKHSGLICLDFDKFPDEKEMSLWRSKLSTNEYTYCLFTSPSGDGLKILVKIPPEKENHKGYFDALKEYFDCKYFDISCSNISRVCYESYDPNIYVNEQALTWVKREQYESFSIGDNAPSIILKSENIIIQNLLEWWKGKFGMTKDHRNNNIYKLAAAFNDFGVSQNEADRTLKVFSEKDFTENEINNIIKSAYKNKGSFGTKFFEDKFTKQKIEKQIKAGKSIKDIQASLPDISEEEIESATKTIKETLQVTEFWQYDDNGKIKLRPHKFKEYLQQQGFYKLYPSGSNNFVFVKIEENKVDDTMPAIIKDTVLYYLYSSPDFGISPYDFMANSPKYFKDDYLSLIDTANIDFKEDTDSMAYLYYKNFALEISKYEIKEIDYLELQGFIWRKQIIDREYKKTDCENTIFKKFVWLISGQEEKRYNSLRSVIGRLLHSYKSSGGNKAIIFNDQLISENPNGGSGKGLICTAISNIKKMCRIDGKLFDIAKSFPYQTVGADTQILVFDDVKKNFSFENLFSLVTEGITLEKKNKDAIKIPVDKSPQIVITTNYTIGGSGGSFERRKFEVELSTHFGADWTPQQEFKHEFFDDWSDDEWLRFDNFMIECLQYYLNNGLVKHEFQNLEIRKFIKETSFEFYEFTNDGEVHIDTRIIKPVLYEEFIKEYPDTKKWLSQKKFSQWLDSYARFMGLKINSGKSVEGRWVELISNEPKKEQHKLVFKEINEDENDSPF